MRRSSVFASGLLILGLSSAAVAASQASDGSARARVRLAVGDPLPTLKGEYLNGGDASLPRDVAGKVALLALGFSYESRRPVEAWTATFRNRAGSRPGITWLQIPMIGGMGRLARPFINRGMRRDTPPAEQAHVVTVYGIGDWKARMGVADDTAAYLVLVDGKGIIRWLSIQRIVTPEALASLTETIDRLAPQGLPGAQGVSVRVDRSTSPPRPRR